MSQIRRPFHNARAIGATIVDNRRMKPSSTH